MITDIFLWLGRTIISIIGSLLPTQDSIPTGMAEMIEWIVNGLALFAWAIPMETVFRVLIISSAFWSIYISWKIVLFFIKLIRGN